MKQHYIKCLFLCLSLFTGTSATFAYDAFIDGIYYNLSGNEATVTYRDTEYNSYSGSVTIPRTIEYNKITYNVTSIGKSAFSGSTDMTSVTIPEGIISIGSEAFYGCTGLTSVTIPESVTSMTYSVTGYVGNTWLGAFIGCTNLVSVNINSNSVASGPFEPWGGWVFRLKSLTAYFGNQVKHIAFGGNVTNIGRYACYGLDLESVTIGNSVKSIEEDAFYECSNIKSLNLDCDSIKSWFQDCRESLQYLHIGDNTKSIGNFAFYKCSALTSVTIGNSTNSIGEFAFYGCSSLTSTTIPNSVTLIDEGAFSHCSALTEINIPNGVASINDYVFSGCSSLTSINIPTGVQSIGYEAFNNCISLASITIPESVTSIGNRTFYGCSGLFSITIPDSVTSIGDYAFSDCNNLTSVHITDLAAWCGITFGGYSANPLCYAHHLFVNGEEITDLVIPDGVTSIGNYAFYGCSGLNSVTIPNSVTSIGNAAFDGCSGLTSVTIPNSVTSIGDYAFRSCSGLTSITIPNSVTSIGEGAFYECFYLAKVYCLAERIPETASDAFDGNAIENATLYVPTVSLEAYQATWPWNQFGTIMSIESAETGIDFADANVKAICVAKWDTDGDGELSRAEAADVTDLGEVFEENTAITSFDELKYFTGLTSIGGYTFFRCRSLTSVTIPESVTSIGIFAFEDCNSLTSITVPNSVTSIGIGAIGSCSSLTSIVVESGNTIYDSRDNCNAIIETASNTLIAGCMNTTIPNSVTSIGGGAFIGCRSLTSISIPESVSSIGSEAFSYCSGLTSVTIPESVTNIGWNAFYGCSSLTSVTIPNSVTSIGISAFKDCSSLTSVTIPESVTSIGDYAFFDCSSLTSVTVKWDTPLTISSNTFTSRSNATLYVPAGCTAAYAAANYWRDFKDIMESVIYYSYNESEKTAEVIALPTGKYEGDIVIPSTVIHYGINYNVTSIGKYAFRNCDSVTSINIPESVTSIGDYAFRGCVGLTSVTIPNSVTSIGKYAFADCQNLTSVTIPNSVTSINSYTFYGCSSLTSVIIPESVTSIGWYAFAYCDKLTSFTIPESVTSIGFYAFDSCSSLTSVTIPNSVTSIGNYVFRNCNSLTKVYCLAEIVPNTNKNTFLNFPISSATLYVPASSLEEYETTAPWSEFGTIVGLTEDQIDGIEAIESEETKIGSSYYDLGGHKLDRQQKGVNIIRYSDGTTRKVMVK